MRLPSLVAVLLMAPLLAAPSVAGAPPSSIPLPDDFQPEGIALGEGRTFYVGSLRDGDIYRGDLGTGAGSAFIDAAPGRAAVGMRVDKERELLVVAGGGTGHVYFYDTTSGDTVADVAVGSAGAFTNDVALMEGTAYFTDTFAPKLYTVRYGDGSWTTGTITVTGPAGSSEPNTFGLNGIDAAPGHRLIVNHTALGLLALVDPSTGASTAIAVTGSLAAGTLDGLQLEGHTAWVVENFANAVAEVRLAPDLSSGTVVQTITSPLFRVPTTIVRQGSRLAVVNGRFDLGFPPPFGPGAPPGTDFDVVQFRP